MLFLCTNSFNFARKVNLASKKRKLKLFLKFLWIWIKIRNKPKSSLNKINNYNKEKWIKQIKHNNNSLIKNNSNSRKKPLDTDNLLELFRIIQTKKQKIKFCTNYMKSVTKKNWNGKNYFKLTIKRKIKVIKSWIKFISKPLKRY